MKIVAYFLVLYNINGGGVLEIYRGRNMPSREDCVKVSNQIEEDIINGNSLKVACIPVYNTLKVKGDE